MPVQRIPRYPSMAGVALHGRCSLAWQVQRIPRYRLLLEQLAKATPADHADAAPAAQALAQIERIGTAVNEAVRTREAVEKVIEAQQRVESLSTPSHRKAGLPA